MALPIQGTSYTFYITLGDGTGGFETDPTIIAGDFQVSQNGGPFANLTNTPTVSPTGSSQVRVDLTDAEMNAAKVNVNGIDQGAIWQDIYISIDVPTGSIETQLDIEKGDRTETNSRLIIVKAGTSETVLDKTITGSLLADGVTIETDDT